MTRGCGNRSREKDPNLSFEHAEGQVSVPNAETMPVLGLRPDVEAGGRAPGCSLLRAGDPQELVTMPGRSAVCELWPLRESGE